MLAIKKRRESSADQSAGLDAVSMIEKHVNGLTYYQFETLPLERVRHGIFTRLGGVSQDAFSTLNLSSSVCDEPEAVAENRRRFYAAIEVDPSSAIRTVQVHGTRVAAVNSDDVGRIQKATDALVTRTPEVALVMAFADCVPIMLFDPVKVVIGLMHAGWRGLAGGVCEATVRRMEAVYGCQAADIRAGIGPAIGPCCYEIGPDVVEAFQSSFGDISQIVDMMSSSRPYLDLWAASALALRRLGVVKIEVARLCTACRVDQFYSHRREGGRTGRFGAIIALRP
jgi:YfiH family protein